MKRSFSRPALLLVAAAGSLLCPSFGGAQQTKTWEQTSFADFEKGTADRVSMRSDGVLEPAPRLTDLHEAPESYLWDVVVAPSGAIFAAAGPEAAVLKIDPLGQASTFFETEAIEVHALALDAEGFLYAASSPEAKIHRIAPDGTSTLYYDPQAVYVWDMAFGPDGALYVATGDEGKVHRVTGEGQGEIYFDTGEAHVRSLAFDSQGRLVVGTDPGGLIMRITESGGSAQGFVLYQTSKKEVTSIAAGADGSIYAAGVGNRISAVPTTTRTVTPTTSTQSSTQQSGSPHTGQTTQPAPQRAPSASTVALRVQGGSEVVRIAPDGEPREMWSDPEAIVYALGFDADDRLLIGTGDKGRLYRLEPNNRYSLVLAAPSNQITAIAAAPDDAVVLAASNIGKLHRLGPETEAEGVFESDVFDAELFTHWGALEADSEGSVALALRSGNLDRPARTWSAWSESGEAPSSRFAQWKATFSSAGDAPPRLDAARLYYRPANRKPRIEALELTPPNFRFPPRRTTVSPRTVTLPALGAGAGSRRVVRPQQPPQTLTQAPARMGLRWSADDVNDDTLLAKVEIQGLGESSWILLEDEIGDSEYDFDSAAFADGRYRLRVTVSDIASNTDAEALEDSRLSEPFLIDNSAPAVAGLSAVREGDALVIRFKASDAASKIERAEYSINGGDWRPALPASGLFDAQELAFDFTAEGTDAAQHVVAVRVFDARDNTAAAKTVVP